MTEQEIENQSNIITLSNLEHEMTNPISTF